MKRRTGITHKLRNSWVDGWERKNADSDIYHAFIQTQDIKSKGAKSRTPDYEISFQERECLSENESLMFLHLLYDQRITWIKEQYPLLPIERAQYIAKSLDVRYSIYPYTRVPVVMTSDFYCGTVFDRNVVYSVKPATELQNQNTKNKLKIEKLFWESQNVKWYLVVDNQLKTAFGSNLQKIAPFVHLNDSCQFIYPGWLKKLPKLIEQYQHESCAGMLQHSAKVTGIDYINAVGYFHHALWHRKITADLTKPLHYERTVSELGIQACE